MSRTEISDRASKLPARMKNGMASKMNELKLLNNWLGSNSNGTRSNTTMATSADTPSDR